MNSQEIDFTIYNTRLFFFIIAFRTGTKLMKWIYTAAFLSVMDPNFFH